MSAFWGVAVYEYRTSMRRWGVWVAMAAVSLLANEDWAAMIDKMHFSPREVAGFVALLCNAYMPLVAGIVLADRLVRDRRLGVRELLRATPLSLRSYVLGKYVGATLGVLTPALFALLLSAIPLLACGARPAFLAYLPLAFLGISVPAFLFVGAFSLACTEVLPVRVYQILFVGYWVWGNLVAPDVMPTLNGTLLTPKGDYVVAAFFGARQIFSVAPHTRPEALASVAALLASAGLALWALARYLKLEEQRA